MPYIEIKRRIELDAGSPPHTAGELNYNLTKACHKFIVSQTKINYQTFNDVIGALEGCKLEIYRRLVVEYEEKKIIENGDVTIDV